MPVAVNTFADFLGDFPKRDFREGTPGREVAEFIADGLRDRGFAVQAVEDVDCDHCIDCVSGQLACEVHVSIDSISDMNRWNVQCTTQRRLGYFERTFDRWDVHAFERLLVAVDEVLAQSDRIRNVRWFPSFDTPDLLEKQVAYAGPRPDQPLNTIPDTPGSRLVALCGRILDWCWSPVLFFLCVISGVVAACAGRERVSFLCFMPLVFTLAYTFAYHGVGLWMLGWELFRERRQQRSAFSYPGLVIAFLGGALLLWIGVSALYAFLAALLRGPPA